ncbi:MAG: phosphoribosyltransferase family protein [Solirubrobacteraceae bacterium]
MTQAGSKRFTDRSDAGQELAERLETLHVEDPVVFGLARGGLPVAYEVAKALHAPLDVLAVCRIYAPGNPALAIGGLAEGDVRVLNHQVLDPLHVGVGQLETVVARARMELEQRVRSYRHGRPPTTVRGRTAILVVDGLASGSTSRAALRATRAHHPRRLVLATPMGATDTLEALREEVDDLVCLLEVDPGVPVRDCYERFELTTEHEVTLLLARAAGNRAARAKLRSRKVTIPVSDRADLEGELSLPNDAVGLVMFAHGSGSSRRSPRKRVVAQELNRRGLATLLVGLLTADEVEDLENLFDVDLDLLAARLVAATRWVGEQPRLAKLQIGLFGAGTGAAPALQAAAELSDTIGAVVTRGGRPDLVSGCLHDVRAPVLLIVGGLDEAVLELNRAAQSQLGGTSELAVIPGATHRFEELGALDEVARLAADWFSLRLAEAVVPGVYLG